MLGGMDAFAPPPETSRRHWTPAAVGLGDDAPVRVARHVHDRGTSRHDHDFWEIVLMVSGRAYHETDVGVAPLEPRSAAMIPPGTFHAYTGCESLDIINCAILPSVFRRELAFAAEAGPVARLLHAMSHRLRPTEPWVEALPVEPFTRCLDVLGPVATVRTKPQIRRPLELIGRLLVVLDVLADTRESRHSADEPPPPVVRRAASLLEGAPDAPWKVAELAAEVNIAPAYLSRLFTASLGVPPMTYLGQIRTERAAALLRRTDDTVGQIARAVGYGSPEHFSRLFRRAFGVRPTTYRARHRS